MRICIFISGLKGLKNTGFVLPLNLHSNIVNCRTKNDLVWVLVIFITVYHARSTPWSRYEYPGLLSLVFSLCGQLKT